MNFYRGYVWTARVTPSVMVFAPLMCFVFLVTEMPTVGAVAPMVGIGAVLICAVEWVRTHGRKAERRLLKKWGGFPTSSALRATTPTSAETMRRRRAVEKLTGAKLPSATAEASDPIEADRAYARAVRTALALVRSNKLDSELLAHENASYGLRRNLLGTKPYGIAILIVCVAIQVTLTIVLGLWGVLFVLLGINATLLLFWTFVVTDDWVAEQADRFSERFFVVLEANVPNIKKG